MILLCLLFMQNSAYEVRISDWSSDVFSSDLLALLLHGWEVSAESSYMRLAAAQFLQRGFANFRLEFRDHGDSHHLNQALFHSDRIDEVLQIGRASCRERGCQYV